MQDAERQSLIALAERNQGRLTPEEVVEVARDPRHPLHGRFEWDDQKAGHAYRLAQARSLIRSVEVVITTHRLQIAAPLLVRDPDAGRGQGYASLASLRSRPDAAREAVLREMQAAASALRRARAVAAALNVESLLDVADRAIGEIVIATERADGDGRSSSP